ncbi:hypothetical protein GQ457_15G010710 [Hibiscus cannabinus]
MFLVKRSKREEFFSISLHDWLLWNLNGSTTFDDAHEERPLLFGHCDEAETENALLSSGNFSTALGLNTDGSLCPHSADGVVRDGHGRWVVGVNFRG